jgi:transposase
MANRLKMAMIETIVSLHERGWSQRRIAREFGIDRETVARHLALARGESKPAIAPTGCDGSEAGSKPANAPTGSGEGEGESKPATASQAPTGSEGTGGVEPAAADGSLRTGRPSLCEPWRAAIVAKLEQGLSAQRIYQDLVAEQGFDGKYPSVRRFVRQLLPQEGLPFRRMECGPGEEAQVDFGKGAFLEEADGRRRRPHVFRIVLSYSRKAYSEVVPRQTTEAFVRCLENAFWHFGGVPQRLVLDNLRAAVSKADWFDPELNPKVRSFAQHYGIALLPTKPYTPRHKDYASSCTSFVSSGARSGKRRGSMRLIP